MDSIEPEVTRLRNRRKGPDRVTAKASNSQLTWRSVTLVLAIPNQAMGVDLV
jgi:hypothetical protein